MDELGISKDVLSQKSITIQIFKGDNYMAESSRYNITNTQSNVSIENQGHNPQTINITAENITLAMQDLKSDIDKLEDATKKEIADTNFELLNTYIELKNKEKASIIVEKLKNTLGNVSSLITIGSFLATL